MNKFYHIDNKGIRNAKSHWLIAKNPEDAFRIASTQEGVPENLQELTPEKNIQELIESEKTGLLAINIQTQSFEDIFGRNKKEYQPFEKPWFIYLEV